MQPSERGQCGFCFAAVTCSLSSRSGLAAVTCPLSSSSGIAPTSGSSSLRSGLAAGTCSSSSRSGLAPTSGSSSSRSGLADGLEDAEDWNVYRKPGVLIDQIRDEHWRWKQQWNQELAKAVVGAEAAALHGEHLEYLEDILLDLEEELSSYDESFGSARKLKAMVSGQGHSPVSAHPVLQTYTVGQRSGITCRSGNLQSERS